MGKKRWIALLLASLFVLQSIGFAVDTNDLEEEITAQTIDSADDQQQPEPDYVYESASGDVLTTDPVMDSTPDSEPSAAESTSDIESEIDLNLTNTYNARITVTPANAELTIKCNGVTLSQKESSGGTYIYELTVGETYQFIAKVPDSQKYKEVNQTVTIQKKSDITIDVTRGAGSLRDLILNTDQTSYQNGQLKLSAQFSRSIEEYTAELVGSTNTAYLWLKPYKDTTKLTVTSGGKTLSATSKSGYLRYTVKFSDGETKKTIQVTASGDDGTVNTYTITVEHYEKFELSLVRDLTGRTGSSTLTLTLSSPREGQGYLKVVSPGVNVTEQEIISEGYKFNVNKGNTMLKISGFAQTARDIYIIAKDADGNCTPRFKISISDYGSNSKNYMMSLSYLAYTYNGKVKKPTVTVRDNTGKKISSKYYTVSYAKGRKNVGSYKVTVRFTGTKYSGTLSKTFFIKPKATALRSVTEASKGFSARWSRVTTQTTGYQLQYSTSSKFTNTKTVWITSNKTTSKKITKLAAKKKYYVRVRTYKTVSGKKYYSAWSKTKAVTTKK